MSTPTMRKNFLRNTQKAVINGERRRFNETSSFLNDLNGIIDDSLDEVRKDLINLMQRPNVSSDLGLQFRIKMKKEVAKEINSLKSKMNLETVARVEDHLSNVYERTAKDIGNSVGIKFPWAKPDKRTVAEVINYPFKGIMWSNRVWNNVNGITKDLQHRLSVGIMTGDSYVNIAKKLNKEFLQAGQKVKYCTERIVRTETARVRYSAEVKAYKDMGVEEVEFCAIIDSKTSKVCKDNDKVVFKLGEEPMIPLHPHCRSSYLPIIKDNFKKSMEKIEEIKRQEENNESRKEIFKSEEERTKLAGDTVSQYLNRKSTYDNFTLKELEKALKDCTEKDIDSYLWLKETYENYKAFSEGKGGVINYGDTIEKTIRYPRINMYGKEEVYFHEFLLPRMYKSYDDGKMFIEFPYNYNKKEKEKVLTIIRNSIAKNPRLEGIKISIDTKRVSQGDDDSGKVMGFYSPSTDSIFMRDLANYKKEFKTANDGSDRFEKTFTHELGHRLHNPYETVKKAGISLNKKEWDKWKETVDPYYIKYYENKGYYGEYSYNRMQYPVSAQDYYKNGTKENFYEEMWAETHSITLGTNASDKNNLDQYFPNLSDTLKDLI